MPGHRYINYPLLMLALLVGGGCRHSDQGQTLAHERPVGDGCVVLVRSGNEIGAFILKNQDYSISTRDRTDYIWRSRSDGGGDLSISNSAVTSGEVINVSHITFGKFSIDWSVNSTGFGWLYYSQMGTHPLTKADFEMCVTTERNLDNITNANSSQWVYRSRSSVDGRALLDSQLKH